ncbi:MAG: Uma2 family endonuclease [Bacillota bacterium]
MKFVAREAKPEAATKETYTYGDYLTWLDDERWELIDGIPYNMTPAPSRSHQVISRELLVQIAVYLTGKTCEVYAAPFDVRLPKGDEEDELIDTVVQPNLVVVCDPEKLDERGCRGAPDWVVEILSPETAAKDMKIKRDLYERVGVKEYWLVDPANKTVQVYTRGDDGRYGRPEVYAAGDQVKVGIFPDLFVDLAKVFGG